MATHRLPSGEHIPLPLAEPAKRRQGLSLPDGRFLGVSLERWLREYCEQGDALLVVKREDGWVSMLNVRTRALYVAAEPPGPEISPDAEESEPQDESARKRRK